jgi:hypothetical protein
LLQGRLPAGLEPGSFDAAFVELVDDDIAQLAAILDVIVPLVRPSGQILLIAINNEWSAEAGHFGWCFATNASSLVGSRLWPDEVRISAASRLRWWVNGACVAAIARRSRHPAFLMPVRLAAAVFLVPLALGLNLASSWCADRPLRGRIVSSVFMRFRVGPDAGKNGVPRTGQSEGEIAERSEAAGGEHRHSELQATG